MGCAGSSDAGTARPRLHLTAPQGWLNDPVGVVWREDRYHAFFQAVPDSTVWRPWCSWGHATGPDLVTWSHHPAALAPGDGDLGCWSGDVYAPPGRPPILFYTSVREPDLNRGWIRTAHPTDGTWRTWRKAAPVVGPPPVEGLEVFRDPTVLRDGAGWRMLVGAGLSGGRAAVLSFRSAHLDRWDYDGVLAQRSGGESTPIATGTAWECPHLVRIQGQDVLIVSTCDRGAAWYPVAGVGRYAEGRMQVRRWARLGFGGHYAPTLFTDRDGHPCLLFWIQDVAGPGWSGALSIPYRLSLAGDAVQLDPHPDVRGARAPGPGPALDWGAPGRPPSGRLTLRSPRGEAVASLTAEHGTVTVSTVGAPVAAPLGTGAVTLIVDRGMLEVCTGAAVVGLAMRDEGQHLEPAAG